MHNGAIWCSHDSNTLILRTDCSLVAYYITLFIGCNCWKILLFTSINKNVLKVEVEDTSMWSACWNPSYSGGIRAWSGERMKALIDVRLPIFLLCYTCYTTLRAFGWCRFPSIATLPCNEKPTLWLQKANYTLFIDLEELIYHYTIPNVFKIIKELFLFRTF